MALILKDLLPSGQTVISVCETDSVDVALERMQRHEFSQLPVVDANSRCTGEVVTHASILRGVRSMESSTRALLVRDVIRRVMTQLEDADLISTLDEIQRDDFVIIVDEDDKLIGLVTTSDTTTYFREYAQDLMLIEGIESNVKELINSLYAKDGDGTLAETIAAVADRAVQIRKKLPGVIDHFIKSLGGAPPQHSPEREKALAQAEKRLGLTSQSKGFDELSFDEIIRVLLKHSGAPRLSTSTDLEPTRQLLERIRDARNKLAHFRGELTADEREHIKYAAQWLERSSAKVPPPPLEVPLASIEIEPIASGQAPDGAGEDTEPAGTYAKLSEFLSSRPKSPDSITLSFESIAGILNKDLPRSALEFREWWSNHAGNPQAMAWLSQGWKAQAVSIGDQRVTFARTNARENDYISFFSHVRAILEKHDEFPLRDGGSQGTNWEYLAEIHSRVAGAVQVLAVFGRRKTFRIELYLDTGEFESTKDLFRKLRTHRDSIESELQFALDWQPLEGRRACRVALAREGSILANVDDKTLQKWAADSALAFYGVFNRVFQNEGF